MSAYILVADSQPTRLHMLLGVLKHLRRLQPELLPVKSCTTADQVLAFSTSHACPVVFAAANLSGTSGLGLMERLLQQNSRTNFILLADRKEDVVHALLLKLRLSGSIMGMPDEDAVIDQLDNLRYPLED